MNNWFFKFNQFPVGNYMFKLSNKKVLSMSKVKKRHQNDAI